MRWNVVPAFAFGGEIRSAGVLLNFSNNKKSLAFF